MIVLSYALVAIALASNTFGVIDYGDSIISGRGSGSWSVYNSGTSGDNSISVFRQNTIDGDNLNKRLSFRVLMDVILSTSTYVQPSIDYVITNKQLSYYYPSYVISVSQPKYFDICLDINIEFLTDFEIKVGYVGKKLYQVKSGIDYIDNPAFNDSNFNNYLNAIEINPNIISNNDIKSELNNLNGLNNIILGSFSGDISTGAYTYYYWQFTDGADITQLDFFGLNLNFSYNADAVGEQNYNTGYNTGYETGYNDGEKNGYETGYNDGVTIGSSDNNVFGLINNAFRGIADMLSFEIAPNLSIGVLLLIPVALGVLLFVIKLITA